jgi:signal transduction histidine kinase
MDAMKRSSNKALLTICLLGFVYVWATIADVALNLSDKFTDSVKLALIVALCLIVSRSGRTFFEFTNTKTVFLISMSLLVLIHVTELTEEFPLFGPVPLIGEMTTAKRIYETALMCGIICSFLGGIYLSFFEINRARKQLSEANHLLYEDRSQLKSLVSQLSLTEERERRRMATELHDQISQSLVFSKIKLDELHQSATSSELTKALDEICNNINQVIQDTRTLTFDLSSPILNEIGLEAAVAEWLDVQVREKHGIETEFVDDGQQKPLDGDIRALLFRNVRELLVNVIKHADAHKVKVSFRRVNEHIHIDVEDDGKGFDSVKVISTGIEDTKFGLFSIRQRLEQLGGEFEIDTEERRGSKITMTAPLKKV